MVAWIPEEIIRWALLCSGLLGTMCWDYVCAAAPRKRLVKTMCLNRHKYWGPDVILEKAMQKKREQGIKLQAQHKPKNLRFLDEWQP